jgi:hypothetical protein
MHVSYGCRHAGACCSSGWPIAIERARAAAVGRLRGDGSWLVPAPGAPPEVAGTIAVTAGGHCVFHGDGCGIQRALGHAALPSACQHFPREVLIDGRGAFVTLSHYCPTAVDLLFDHAGPVEIVEGPPAIPQGDPEGLDARDVLPPLLTEGVLMDLDGYSAWEAHMVRVLSTDDGRSARDAVTALEHDLAVVQRWRPGDYSLSEDISRLPVTAASGGTRSGQGMNEMVIRRYLAARAFASWMAYQGGGVSAVLGSLRVALSVLDEESVHLPLKDAIRQTDLRLLHLMPRASLVAMACQR